VSTDDSIRVWDVGSGRNLANLKPLCNTSFWGCGFQTVVALQNNTRALSGGFDRTLRLWDLTLGKCVETIKCGPHYADDVFSSAVHPAGIQALSGHRNGCIRLWNLKTGECLATLEGHSSTVSSVHITPDGRFAVSSSHDKTIKIWDLGAGTCIGTLEGHNDGVMSVAISPDVALIASTGSLDKTIRLWDWKSGACLQVIKPDKNLIPTSSAFSPDGLRLVVGMHKLAIYIYRLTGVHVAPTAE